MDKTGFKVSFMVQRGTKTCSDVAICKRQANKRPVEYLCSVSGVL